jgi:hypothetical protein
VAGGEALGGAVTEFVILKEFQRLKDLAASDADRRAVLDRG